MNTCWSFVGMVLNPIRAGMVKDLHEWPWSSYGAMIEESPSPDWLETDCIRQ